MQGTIILKVSKLFKVYIHSHVSPKACTLFQPFIKKAHKFSISSTSLSEWINLTVFTTRWLCELLCVNAIKLLGSVCKS